MKKNEMESVLQAIDYENNQDPRKESFEGDNIGYELFYSKLMFQWINILTDRPSEELLIAGRGIHLKRWQHPRDSYPKGLPGYYQWKKDLQKFHSQEVVRILDAHLIDKTSIQKISDLILKTNLGNCNETQVLEDAVSLIFIEHQLLPLLEKSNEEKVINAIQKTWKKMSPNAQQIALELKLPDNSKVIIEKALN